MTATQEPTTRLVDVDGPGRRLLVVEPAGTPAAVLLSLHGSRSSPE